MSKHLAMVATKNCSTLMMGHKCEPEERETVHHGKSLGSLSQLQHKKPFNHFECGQCVKAVADRQQGYRKKKYYYIPAVKS